MSIPSRQKPGAEVKKSVPCDTPKSAKEHKPANLGLSPTGGSHNRGKGQK